MNKNVKKAVEMAIEYSKTGNGELLSKLMSFGYENDVFVCEGEDYIAVEDDVFYYNF